MSVIQLRYLFVVGDIDDYVDPAAFYQMFTDFKPGNDVNIGQSID